MNTYSKGYLGSSGINGRVYLLPSPTFHRLMVPGTICRALQVFVGAVLRERHNTVGYG